MLNHDIKELYCEKHKQNYKARRIFADLYANCPLCNDEIIKQREAEALQEKLRQEQEIREYQEYYLLNLSNIPKRYQQNMPIESFGKYSKFLKSELKQNLFLLGDVGVGKTTFLTSLLKANVAKSPYYLNCNELLLLLNDKFKIIKLFETLNNKGIVGIDEAQMLFLNNEVNFLNSLVDYLYNRMSIMIFCGNFKDTKLSFLNDDKFKRLSSRIKEGGCSILQFKEKFR